MSRLFLTPTLLLTLGVFGVANAVPTAQVTGLRVEYLQSPLGIDTRRPRFSWRMESAERGARQSAYQIQVATSEELLASGKPDMWDSGKVSSSQCVGVRYSGRDLSSRTRYWWRVRIWDGKDRPSRFSEAGWFETAFLQPGGWKARWITGTGDSPLLRREFNIPSEVKRARVYVTGLGYYELHLNGRKVGDRVLDPPYSNFGKRIYYSTYDVTGMLKRGNNCAGAILGHGWWQKPSRFLMQMEIEFSNGRAIRVVTDGNWRSAPGPILENSLYHGETYDAGKEQPGWDRPNFDDSSWTPVQVVRASGAALSAQSIQPIKVVERLKARSIASPKPGIFVFDFGQNFSGWCRLKVSGPAGTTVKLRHAELLYDDGTVNQENLRTAKATDTYILRGAGQQTYEPRFTYHGFRYVQVEGYPGEPNLDALLGCVVHTSFEQRGKFSCSNEMLNKVQSCCLWGERTNFHSIPTDCPQRDERQGWMGDAHMSAYAMLFNFDMAAAYSKFLRDIADAQREDGAVPDTVPRVWGSQPGDPMWAAAYPIILWDSYRHIGDRSLPEEHYDGVKRYVEMLRREAKDFIIERNNYGDWIGIVETPKPLISTGAFYLVCNILARMAEVLGRQADAEEYRNLCKQIADAFNACFFDPTTGQYGNGSQFSNAFPLYLGIVPEERRKAVLESIVRDVMENHNGHLSTGFIGTPYLMQVLVREGRADVAYTIASQETYPGWGYMVSKGATTIWELWRYETGPGMNSHNHPALSLISGWFYEVLAGIVPEAEYPGWEHFIIRPHILGDLRLVDASVQTVRGLVCSHWKLTKSGIDLQVVIPPNSRATVHVPKAGRSNIRITEGSSEIWQNGRFVPGVAGISAGRDAGDWIAFEVGAGNYSFAVEGASG